MKASGNTIAVDRKAMNRLFQTEANKAGVEKYTM